MEIVGFASGASITAIEVDPLATRLEWGIDFVEDNREDERVRMWNGGKKTIQQFKIEHKGKNIRYIYIYISIVSIFAFVDPDFVVLFVFQCLLTKDLLFFER